MQWCWHAIWHKIMSILKCFICVWLMSIILLQLTIIMRRPQWVGHRSEQFKNLCTFSDSIFSTLPLHNINILASFFFTSYILPEIKCKNSSFSNLCLQIIFWGSFFPIKSFHKYHICNFWLHSQLMEILRPIILTKNSFYYVLFNFFGEK